MAKHFRNTYQTYGWVAIVVHWLMFPLVLFLLLEGVYMVTLSYYEPLYHILPDWHKRLGVLAFVLTLFRVLWSLTNKSPFLLTASHAQRAAARGAHGLLYLLLLVMGITGYLMTTAEGQGIPLFAGTSLPPLSLISAEGVMLLGTAHRWSAYFMAALIFVHAAAALLHHFYYRDKTLVRMLKPIE